MEFIQTVVGNKQVKYRFTGFVSALDHRFLTSVKWGLFSWWRDTLASKFSSVYWALYSWTRLHSSRMHTTRLLIVSPSRHCAGGVCLAAMGSPCWGGSCQGVVSQHALKQTPPCEQNSWHTLLKILPCPKLHLRVVISDHQVEPHWRWLICCCQR